jgi:hypothetical protein
LVAIQLLWNPKGLQYIHKYQSMGPGPVGPVESSLHLRTILNVVFPSPPIIDLPNGLFIYQQDGFRHCTRTSNWTCSEAVLVPAGCRKNLTEEEVTNFITDILASVSVIIIHLQFSFTYNWPMLNQI